MACKDKHAQKHTCKLEVDIHLLIGGLGVGPAIEVVDIVVSDFLSITEYLLAVHAQSLMV